MKKLTTLIGLIFTLFASAQTDFSDNWEDFYSYNNVKDFVVANNVIYAISDNAVFTYNESSNETKKLSSVNGLSGNETSSFYYDENLELLVIGYSNGLIELIDKNQKITIAKDIQNFISSGSKSINSITGYQNLIYISTSFAIVVYDLEKKQFGDTYFIGNQSSELKINQVAVFNNTIYAATENGIYFADINNENLIDYNNWQQLFSGDFSSVLPFNNKIYVAQNKNVYQLTNNQLILFKSFNKNVISLKASSSFLTINTIDSYSVYNVNLIEINNGNASNATYNYQLNTSYFDNNTIYLGTQNYGVLKKNLGELSFTEIHPEGPSSNNPFSITANSNQLYVVYGGYNTAYGPLGKRFGFSHFNGSNWVNKPYNSDFGVRDFVHVTIDPNDINKAYISSWGGGMVVVENDTITTHWDHTNSGLEKLDLPSNPNYVSIRINGSSFDNQGNLWIANAWVDNRIKKYSSSGNWSSFDMSATITNVALGLNELVIDKTNTIWIGSRRNGVLVFNENGNKKTALTTEITKGSLPDLNARTVAADNSNRIWIGTKKGLVVLYNGSSILNESSFDAQPIIINDDGIAKKLLGDQPINSIAIDGADNKWFGTEISGATQTNSDGAKILHQFTTTNSPLPSNNILKVAVDKETGKVFFATDKGIVAYNGKVAPYGNSISKIYAYPNPSIKSNELITIDGLEGNHLPLNTNIKILDAAGNLVFEANIKEGLSLYGGKIVWNKRNLAGRKVASGIYIVLVYNSDTQETTSTKIAIIN